MTRRRGSGRSQKQLFPAPPSGAAALRTAATQMHFVSDQQLTPTLSTGPIFCVAAMQLFYKQLTPTRSTRPIFCVAAMQLFCADRSEIKKLQYWMVRLGAATSCFHLMF